MKRMFIKYRHESGSRDAMMTKNLLSPYFHGTSLNGKIHANHNVLKKCRTATILNAKMERSMLLKECIIGCLFCSGKEGNIVEMLGLEVQDE